MKSVLVVSLLGFFFFPHLYAQTNGIEKSFIIRVNPAGKSITFEDPDKIKHDNKTPLDAENKTVSLYSINLQFKTERKEIEQNLFNQDQIDQIKKYRPFAILYICSETKKVEALSFVFRNINESDVEMIDVDKLFQYKDDLKNQIHIKDLFFERNVVKHGIIIQSFRVFL